MPLVKVIRHGQITIPKELRRALNIKEGDYLEVDLSGSGMVIKPKAVMDKELAPLSQTIKEMHERNT